MILEIQSEFIGCLYIKLSFPLIHLIFSFVFGSYLAWIKYLQTANITYLLHFLERHVSGSAMILLIE